jgi:hypothetical protein
MLYLPGVEDKFPHMIRQAVPDDAVPAVPLILEAIGHIAFVLSGTSDGPETTSVLTDFFGRKTTALAIKMPWCWKKTA